MPKRGAAPAARTREKPPEPEEVDPAEAEIQERESEPPPAEEKPARRRRTPAAKAADDGHSAEDFVGKTDEGATELGTNEPLADPEPAAEAKPARRRGAAKSKPAEPRQRHATKDVVEKGFDFSDIDEKELEFGSLDEDDEFVSLLYYGREGTTKTTSALRMTALPGTGKVLLINAEGGAKKQALAKHGVDTKRVVTWPAPGKRVTFDGLEALFYRLAADLDKNPGSWLGVVWDSGTEIVQTVLDQVVEAVIAEQTEILARTNGRAGNVSLRDRFDNDRDDYRKMSNMVRSLVRKYRYLPCHFVMTALTREDEKGKKTVIGPKFTPALSDDILGYMDQVLYCRSTRNKGRPVYYATTVQGDDDRAKDRYDSLPRELVDPGFERVLGYIQGDLVAADDPIQDKMPGGATAEREPEEDAKPVRAGRASGRRAAKKEEEPPADEAQADGQMSEVPGHKPALTDETTEPETVQKQPAPARRRSGRRSTPAAAAKVDESEMTEAQRAIIEEQAAKQRVLDEQKDKEATPAARARTNARQRRASAANANPAPKSGKAAEVKYNDEPPF